MSNLKMEEVLSFILKNAEYGNPQSVLDTIDDFAMNGALDKKRFLMNVGPEKGLILKELINKHEPKRVLELGAFIGYSAVLIAMTIKRRPKSMISLIICLILDNIKGLHILYTNLPLPIFNWLGKD